MQRAKSTLSLVFLLAACSGADPERPAAEAAAQQQSATAGRDAMPDDFKGCPDDIPRFEPGLQADGARYAMRLIDAMPAQPERYSNRWTVELLHGDGTVATDAQLVRGETFMPVHGHDGRVTPEITALSEPGRFQADPVNFTMRGVWETRFWLRDDAAEADDYVVFHVCVAK